MSNFLRLLSAAIVSTLSFSATAAPIDITDDLNRKISLDKPVTKAVVCNPYNAEFFRAIAGSEVIAAIDAEAANRKGYWPNLDPEAVVGNCFKDPNFELMISLKPDIVVMPRNYPWQKAEEVLGDFGIKVVVITGWDVAKNGFNVEMVGKLTGKPERAAKLSAFHDGLMKQIEEGLTKAEPVKVYLEKAPAFKTALVGSGWHDMVAAAGGQNIFADLKIVDQPKSRGSVHQFDIDPEAIIKHQPKVVVKLVPDSYQPASKDAFKTQYQELLARAGWEELFEANKEDVHLIGFFAAGASSKMVGVAYIAKWLHPDLFADLNPDAILKTWLEEWQGVPYPGSYTYSVQN